MTKVALPVMATFLLIGLSFGYVQSIKEKQANQLVSMVKEVQWNLDNQMISKKQANKLLLQIKEL